VTFVSEIIFSSENTHLLNFNMKVFVVMATLMALLLTVSSAENNKSQASTDQVIKSNVPPSSDPKKLARFEQDKKDVTSFLNAKNIVKTIVKLVFGSSEESTATSRQVLNLVVKVLDMLKTSFGQNRARSSTSGRGIRDAFDDAALAGVSMMKGYIKSYMAKDTQNNVCANRFMCEAARDAVRDGREMGFLVAQFGG